MNILLIVNDTLRVDHLGCYGYLRKTSPVMDKLAEEGILFEDFYSSGVATGTAFTSIHTGLYPIHHRVYNVAPVDLQLDGIPTLAEVLRANGYTTVALDNLAYNRMWINDPVHYYRGFEHYICDVSNPRDWDYEGERVRAEWYNDRLIPWIKHHSQQKFFAFVHYWDVHQPYVQPEPYRNLYSHKKGDFSDLEVREAPAGYKYVPGWGKVGEIFEGHGVFAEMRAPGSIPRREASIDLYDGAITYLDRCIGDVVETLRKEKILEDTLILVTSDHGECLGQHNIYTHVYAYDANIHIPLIIRCPSKLPQGRRAKGLSGHVDIFPTILDLANIPNAPPVDGMSLRPLIEGKRLREEIVAEYGGGIRAIRKGEWKLIIHYHDAHVELYNTIEDPMEVVDLAQMKEDKVKELKRDLEQWIKSSLKEGEEDPVQYVVRNWDRAPYKELSIDSERYASSYH